MDAQGGLDGRRFAAVAGAAGKRKTSVVALPLLRGLSVRHRCDVRLKLLETLSLGGRRQLLLVACGDERYLIGAGADTIGSMLRVSDGDQPEDDSATGF